MKQNNFIGMTIQFDNNLLNIQFQIGSIPTFGSLESVKILDFDSENFKRGNFV